MQPKLLLVLAALGSQSDPCLASMDGAPRQFVSGRQSHSSRHVLKTRGGQQAPPDPSYSTADFNENTPNNYDNGFANYDGLPTTTTPNDAEHLFQETVQERVDNWRSAQMERSQNLTPEQELNPRDELGRMKLLASVGKGSRALIFFMLMWRDVHLFENADQALKGTFRLIAVTPLTILFIANMAGFVASLMTPSHAAKKRLKAILNLDKLIECILLVWYFIRLTIFPSKYIPREIFIASTMHSVLFLIQCQAFTRVTWDEISVKPNAPPVMDQSQTYQGQQAFSQDSQSQAGPGPTYVNDGPNSSNQEHQYQAYQDRGNTY